MMTTGPNIRQTQFGASDNLRLRPTMRGESDRATLSAAPRQQILAILEDRCAFLIVDERVRDLVSDGLRLFSRLSNARRSCGGRGRRSREEVVAAMRARCAGT